MDYNHTDLMTVAELPSFQRQAQKLLSALERQELISYLLTLFAKGEKANLNQAERKQLAEPVKHLIKIWSTRHE